MEVRSLNDNLIITIDDQEWEDIFEMNDGEYVDIFADALNMDVLFPDWESYVDRDDVLSNLNFDDAERFKQLTIEFDGSVTDKDGAGTYDIIGYDMNPALDEDDEMMVINADNKTELDHCVMITVHFNR
ncbi:MAG: hypothetical protein MJZ41_09600 [Bacteroidaceae bacterium]|nr:hypothetical protein [Bacteroidaceae bacterium]